MKTIYEYFALTEDEYKLTIMSYVDIHREEYREQIELALQKYDLRELVSSPALPFQSTPIQFPNLTFGTIYTYEATIGQMPYSGYDQVKLELSQVTRIPLKFWFVSEDGNIPTVKTGKADDEALLKQAMGESPRDFSEDDTMAQTMMGQALVDDVLKNMDERRKERENKVKKFSESVQYKTTHDVLHEYTGKSLKKGIYEFTVTDGEINIGNRDDNAEGVFIKNVKELREALVPDVATFADKYRLNAYLNEEEGMDVWKKRAEFLLNVLVHKFKYSIAMKPQFKDNHKFSVSTAAIDFDPAMKVINVETDEETTAVSLSELSQLVGELECDDIIVVCKATGGLTVQFKW